MTIKDKFLERLLFLLFVIFVNAVNNTVICVKMVPCYVLSRFALRIIKISDLNMYIHYFDLCVVSLIISKIWLTYFITHHFLFGVCTTCSHPYVIPEINLNMH